MSADSVHFLGNDNDSNAEQFEPHYDRVERADQLQIYESIMVNVRGRVTGLLSGIRYAKDNKIVAARFRQRNGPGGFLCA